MSIIFGWIKARLKEGTTYAGLISIAQGIGLYISPEVAEAFIPFALAIVGMIFGVRPDNPKIDTTGGTVTVKK